MKRLFYNLLALTQRGSEEMMLNCGYAGEGLEGFPKELIENESEEWGYVLYWKILKSYLKDGDELLEVGCGRGGGLDFVTRWKSLGRVVGVDFAGGLISLCRKRFPESGIDFLQANALALPFEKESFDTLVSVEMSHSLDDKRGFLREALRVLRPGGVFVWVDFVYERASAMHSLEKCEEALSDCDAECIEKIDMSENALAALRMVSEDREKKIEASVWKPMQGVAKDFAVTKESSLYRCLDEGRGRYWMFVLQKNTVC